LPRSFFLVSPGGILRSVRGQTSFFMLSHDTFPFNRCTRQLSPLRPLLEPPVSRDFLSPPMAPAAIALDRPPFNPFRRVAGAPVSASASAVFRPRSHFPRVLSPRQRATPHSPPKDTPLSAHNDFHEGAPLPSRVVPVSFSQGP